MKTDPRRYVEVLALAPRLAPAVADANALRDRRRVGSGVRAFFATRDADWMAVLRTPALGARGKTN